MVEGARARAAELGLANVEFRVLDAEWIDLQLASVDAVLCRWGYMLMVDPAAALRETRRVLRTGGRLALAVWDASQRNPWAQLPDARASSSAASPRRPPAPADARRAVLRSGRRLASACWSRAARGGRLHRCPRRVARARRRHAELRRAVGEHARPLGSSTTRSSPPAAEAAEIEASLQRRFAPYAAR